MRVAALELRCIPAMTSDETSWIGAPPVKSGLPPDTSRANAGTAISAPA